MLAGLAWEILPPLPYSAWQAAQLPAHIYKSRQTEISLAPHHPGFPLRNAVKDTSTSSVKSDLSPKISALIIASPA